MKKKHNKQFGSYLIFWTNMREIYKKWLKNYKKGKMNFKPHNSTTNKYKINLSNPNWNRILLEDKCKVFVKHYKYPNTINLIKSKKKKIASKKNFKNSSDTTNISRKLTVRIKYKSWPIRNRYNNLRILIPETKKNWNSLQESKEKWTLKRNTGKTRLNYRH